MGSGLLPECEAKMYLEYYQIDHISNYFTDACLYTYLVFVDECQDVKTFSRICRRITALVTYYN